MYVYIYVVVYLLNKLLLKLLNQHCLSLFFSNVQIQRRRQGVQSPDLPTPYTITSGLRFLSDSGTEAIGPDGPDDGPRFSLEPIPMCTINTLFFLKMRSTVFKSKYHVSCLCPF